MSNNKVQPAVVIFDTDRAEACGVAPMGVADPTYFAPITKEQRDAGGVRGLATNDVGQMVAPDGAVEGVPVGAVVDQVTGVSIKVGANSVISSDVEYYKNESDGEDILPAFLRAHAALPESGGRIRLTSPGIYTASDSINLVGKSNVSVFIGPGVTLKTVSATTYGHLIAFCDGAVYGGADGKTISNCKIYGGGTLSTPLDLITENVVGFERVHGGSCVGMIIQTAGRKAITSQVNDPTGLLQNKDISIVGNRIGSTGYDAISIEGAHDGATVVTDNSIENSARNGLSISGSLSPNTSIARLILGRNNIVSAGYDGITMFKVIDADFDGDKVEHADNRGIVVTQCGDVHGSIRCLYSKRENLWLSDNAGSISIGGKISGASGEASGATSAIKIIGNTSAPNFRDLKVTGINYSHTINASGDSVFSGCDLKTGVSGIYTGTVPVVLSSVIDGLLRGIDVSSAVPIPTGTTVPSVFASRVVTFGNSIPTLITNFTGGVNGQELTVVSNDTQTSIADGATIKLKDSANWAPTAGNDTISFVRSFGTWYETSRSDN